MDQWERGVFYILGRHWRWWPARGGTLEPGLYFVVPFFWRILPVSVVPVPVSGPLQSITLKDGSQLTFSATAVFQVTDAAAALNCVDNYQDSIVELMSSELAERMARVKPTRITETEERAGLVRDLRLWLGEQTTPFGIEVLSLRFPNFVFNMKTYRLLMDQSVVQQSGW